MRLAAKLTGWKIDIKSEEEKRKEVELQLAGITFGDGIEATGELKLPPGIHDEVVAVLKTAGYDTVEKILEAGAEQLAGVPGFDQETIDAVLAAADAERAAREHAASARAAAEAEAAAADKGEGDQEAPATDEQ